MNSLFDTHCHLYLPDFRDDLTLIIERAKQKNITNILIPGIDIKSSEKAIKLCASQPLLLHPAVGIHPNYGNQINSAIIKELRDLASNQLVVAIGEIGLDYYRNFTPINDQKQLLNMQLKLALAIDKPIIIHNRDAENHLWDIIGKWYEKIPSNSPLKNRPGVFHSFSSSLEFAKQAIKKGFYIGVGGPITYKKSKNYRKLISQLPIERILIETDSPYLAPQQYRGKRNEPSFLVYTAQRLSEIFQINFDTLSEITTRNAKLLFNI
ncbi:MAG TPA: TatD family hydrolase [Anaerolineae bacterium]|nr:TatD family hydrolase [Anaerolineae bacterium]